MFKWVNIADVECNLSQSRSSNSVDESVLSVDAHLRLRACPRRKPACALMPGDIQYKSGSMHQRICRRRHTHRTRGERGGRGETDRVRHSNNTPAGGEISCWTKQDAEAGKKSMRPLSNRKHTQTARHTCQFYPADINPP